MIVRFVKILLAVLLSLTFTISLAKLVLCVWSEWFIENSTDYEILFGYPPLHRGGRSRTSSGGLVDEWLEQNQLGAYRQLFRDRDSIVGPNEVIPFKTALQDEMGPEQVTTTSVGTQLCSCSHLFLDLHNDCCCSSDLTTPTRRYPLLQVEYSYPTYHSVIYFASGRYVWSSTGGIGEDLRIIAGTETDSHHWKLFCIIQFASTLWRVEDRHIPMLHNIDEFIYNLGSSSQSR